VSRRPHPSILAALGAAVLFGASTPFAKLLAMRISPALLAGLLYLGSGAGLWLIRIVRDRRIGWPRMGARDWGCLAAAIVVGGVLGPVLLMIGLTLTSASAAALLLNLVTVLTSALAWAVFREGVGRRVVLGMLLIVAGGVVLGGPMPAAAQGSVAGAAAVGGACLCWALDNNLTRLVAAPDALFVAGTKGLAAGITNLALALILGASLPAPPLLLSAMAVGLIGYGASLVLYVTALRGVGAARTGACFAVAPFVGAAIAVFAFGEPASPVFWIAAALMAAGVWLHLTEHHQHEHTHEAMAHTHSHRHDEHHRHAHHFAWDGSEPHVHEHAHEPITHRHPHYPDLHHGHRHSV
jgi:drug/metabolite transporter (DMT)-like permease